MFRRETRGGGGKCLATPGREAGGVVAWLNSYDL
jgi:hypothetical protein